MEVRDLGANGRPFRIAQVAPLYESVPSPLYGGTERVVSYLTEALVSQGHDVTLFASGDSITKARLIAPCPRGLRLDDRCQDYLAYHMLLLEQVMRHAHRFDLIHFHIDYLHYPFSRRCRTPQVSTLHGRLDLRDLAPLYREYADMPVVSISNAQREPLPGINWQGTVYHGLPSDLLTFRERSGDYLAFLGRTSPEKGLDQAIEIARRTQRKLKIAAKVSKIDEEYFQQQVLPLIRAAQPLVEFVGEIGGAAKAEFLASAYAVLFPINWPEPFGLVMIEAMACGTPVIAYRRGSVPEVMVEGETGFVVDTLDEAIRAVGQVATLDRRRCRRVFDERYTDDRMAAEYVAIYRRLLRNRASKPAKSAASANGAASRALRLTSTGGTP